jgi:hypothetical protein
VEVEMRIFTIALAMLLLPLAAAAQGARPPSAGADGSARPDTRDKDAVQHGAQPNPEEVRPGSRDGDSPSAAAGDVVRNPTPRRIFGLPVNAALLIGGVLVVLLVLAGVVIPNSRRRERARGGGTYGNGTHGP